MNPLVFLHGMESSPQGTKAQFIRRHFPDCIIPELTPDIHARLSVIDEFVSKPSFIVGSSLGGLSALMFAMKRPDLVKAMILIAPAVGFFDQRVFSEEDKAVIRQTFIPPKIPCLVMIGKKDDVIPRTDIDAMIERSPDKRLVRTILRDDDHALNQSLDVLLYEIKEMLLRA